METILPNVKNICIYWKAVSRALLEILEEVKKLKFVHMSEINTHREALLYDETRDTPEKQLRSSDVALDKALTTQVRGLLLKSPEVKVNMRCSNAQL